MYTFLFFLSRWGSESRMIITKMNFLDFSKWLQLKIKEWQIWGVWILSLPTVYSTPISDYKIQSVI